MSFVPFGAPKNIGPVGIERLTLDSVNLLDIGSSLNSILVAVVPDGYIGSSFS